MPYYPGVHIQVPFKFPEDTLKEINALVEKGMAVVQKENEAHYPTRDELMTRLKSTAFGNVFQYDPKATLEHAAENGKDILVFKHRSGLTIPHSTKGKWDSTEKGKQWALRFRDIRAYLTRTHPVILALPYGETCIATLKIPEELILFGSGVEEELISYQPCTPSPGTGTFGTYPAFGSYTQQSTVGHCGHQLPAFGFAPDY